MSDDKKVNRGEDNQRFEVKGKVWFGNKKFYSNEIVKRHAKKDEAIKDFFNEAWKEAKMENINSLSLLFQKYIPIIDAEIEDKREGKREKWFSLKDECIGGDSKKLFLDKFIEKSKNNNELNRFIKNRIENQKRDLGNQGYRVILDNCKLKTASRLIVGLGSDHVLETSLTLHHIFGIPYIPASALKGVVRMVSFWEIAEKENKKTDNDIKNLQEQLYDSEISSSDSKDILKHKLLFGTQGFKGLLVFLDAFPEIQDNQDIFELDVMTPHYSNYYTKGEPPGDWGNPKPITFLTVKKGITFCFNVLFDNFRAEEILKDDRFSQEIKNLIGSWKNSNFSGLSSEIEGLLEDSLKEFGVGAKTRLGYGIFERQGNGGSG